MSDYTNNNGEATSYSVYVLELYRRRSCSSSICLCYYALLRSHRPARKLQKKSIGWHRYRSQVPSESTGSSENIFDTSRHQRESSATREQRRPCRSTRGQSATGTFRGNGVIEATQLVHPPQWADFVLSLPLPAPVYSRTNIAPGRLRNCQ
jgi:hypothetical protein